MTKQEMKMLWRERRAALDAMLDSKNEGYNRKEDKLASFKKAATYLGVTSEEALLGMVAKHLVAVKDYVECIAEGIEIPREEWMEKTIDIQVYMFLLFALTEERRNKGSISVKDDSSSR